jgi:hypothetical protein
MAETTLSAWSRIEQFLAERGFTAVEILRVVGRAQSQGLNASLIVRVLGEREARGSGDYLH